MNLHYTGLVLAQGLPTLSARQPSDIHHLHLALMAFVVFPLAVLGLLANGIIWIISRF